MPGRRWTSSEDAYLEEAWGSCSMARICKKLHRSEAAVRHRLMHIGSGPALESGDFITLRQLMEAVVSSGFDKCRAKAWIKAGLPVRKKLVVKNRFTVTTIDEFWAWADNHRSMINFADIEPLILGEEPDWVQKQRVTDGKDPYKQKRWRPWSPEEESRLKSLLAMKRYGTAELSELLGRSYPAIYKRAKALGIKEAPIEDKGRNRGKPWDDESWSAVVDGIKNAETYQYIAQKIGRSDACIRVKVRSVYGESNIDKVRDIILKGG